jgi:hypothetical protein
VRGNLDSGKTIIFTAVVFFVVAIDPYNDFNVSLDARKKPPPFLVKVWPLDFAGACDGQINLLRPL